MNSVREPKKLVRCAIYTRKSTEEGLQQEFNSLDAQRESAEAFIRSQQHEGWRCVTERYDDGGYTGANIQRPALKRLMQAIEAKTIDAVVVYKVDRLSRSLLDFARLIESFEAHQVSFVSVTQQFNTATSMGRLVLNVLLSFAQFEREIISERTRDKIAATRRKGKWTGGMPLLGYDVDPATKKLVVNADEAKQVQAVLELFIQHQSLQEVLVELDRRGWVNKRWQTRKGSVRGGRQFTKPRLRQLLTNPVYIGKLRYKTELHQGEQEAIVDAEVWQQAQAIFAANRPPARTGSKDQTGSLLRGLLRCRACNCAMTPSFATTRGKRYRYYVCVRANQRGWKGCPSKSLSAGAIERFAIEQVRRLGTEPALGQELLAQWEHINRERLAQLEAQAEELNRERARLDADSRKARAGKRGSNSGTEDAVMEFAERLQRIEAQAEPIHREIETLHRQLREAPAACTVLGKFDAVWDALSGREQRRLIELVVEHIDYDGAEGKVTIAFRSTGLPQYAAELAKHAKEKIR
jgi:site-specific DNA recombinase